MKRSVQDKICDVLVGAGLFAVIGLGSASLWYDAQATTTEAPEEQLLPPLDEEEEAEVEMEEIFEDEATTLPTMEEIPMIEDQPETMEEAPDSTTALPLSPEQADTLQSAPVPAQSSTHETKQTHEATQQHTATTSSHTSTTSQSPASKDTLSIQ